MCKRLLDLVNNASHSDCRHTCKTCGTEFLGNIKRVNCDNCLSINKSLFAKALKKRKNTFNKNSLLKTVSSGYVKLLLEEDMQKEISDLVFRKINIENILGVEDIKFIDIHLSLIAECIVNQYSERLTNDDKKQIISRMNLLINKIYMYYTVLSQGEENIVVESCMSELYNGVKLKHSFSDIINIIDALETMAGFILNNDVNNILTKEFIINIGLAVIPEERKELRDSWKVDTLKGGIKV